jgi:hypothetical protein
MHLSKHHLASGTGSEGPNSLSSGAPNHIFRGTCDEQLSEKVELLRSSMCAGGDHDWRPCICMRVHGWLRSPRLNFGAHSILSVKMQGMPSSLLRQSTLDGEDDLSMAATPLTTAQKLVCRLSSQIG